MHLQCFITTLTKKQFNPEHSIKAPVSSFSVSADYKITTSFDNRKVKYNKTNPSVLAGPWTIYRPWRNRRNAVNHGHMQRKDGFQKSRAEPFSGSAIKRHPERTWSHVLEGVEG